MAVKSALKNPSQGLQGLHPPPKSLIVGAREDGVNYLLVIEGEPTRWHRHIAERLAAMPGVTVTMANRRDAAAAPLLRQPHSLALNLTASEWPSEAPCLTVEVDGLRDPAAWFWRGFDPAIHPYITVREVASGRTYLHMRPHLSWSRKGRVDNLHERIAEAVLHAITRWKLGVEEPTQNSDTPPQPTNAWLAITRETMRLSTQIMTRTARKIGVLPQEIFQVYWREIPAHAPSIAQDPSQLAHCRPLPQPAGHYYADPFLIYQHEKLFVLAEDYDFATRKGTLRRIALDGSVNEEILNEPFHLSYPQAFRHEEKLCMIPESGNARQILLYEAEDGIANWRRRAVLLDNISAVDATIYHHENTWWLFAAVGDTSARKCDTLHLFFADTLEGPYHPHPMNPIVVDATRARPAGPLFHLDGALIRPAQDCLRGYGSAVTLNKVEILSRTRYAESCLKRLEPPPGKTGLHHYHRAGDYEVVDMKIG